MGDTLKPQPGFQDVRSWFDGERCKHGCQDVVL